MTKEQLTIIDRIAPVTLGECGPALTKACEIIAAQDAEIARLNLRIEELEPMAGMTNEQQGLIDDLVDAWAGAYSPIAREGLRADCVRLLAAGSHVRGQVSANNLSDRIRYHIAIRGGPAKDDQGEYIGTTWPMMLEAAAEIDRLNRRIEELEVGSL